MIRKAYFTNCNEVSSDVFVQFLVKQFSPRYEPSLTSYILEEWLMPWIELSLWIRSLLESFTLEVPQSCNLENSFSTDDFFFLHVHLLLRVCMPI